MSVMTDYIWNEENRKIVAKLVLSKDIEPGQRARLGSQDICAIREGGGYTDNHIGDIPILIPKVSLLGKLMRKKPVERDHLFVHKGPHQVDLNINASWSTGKMQDITAEMTVNISSREVGPLFELAERSDGNEITPDDLAKAVQRKVEGTFDEYVMKLSDKPTTVEELRAHQYKFDQIVDEEFGKLGVHVTDGVLRYGDDLDTKVDQISKKNAATRRIKDEKSFHRFAEGAQDVEDEIKTMATKGAKSSELAKKSAARLERDIIYQGEDSTRDELAERGEEKIHAAEKRKIEREGELMKAKADSARNLSKKKSEEDE